MTRHDVVDLHARSVELFLDRVRAVPESAWDAPTPCADWDLRALVNHVVGEDRWTVPLMAGGTIEAVGDSLDGDLLGALPVQAAQDAGKDAVASFAEPGAVERVVALSFGDTPAEEYGWQLVADHLVHAWDVAAAAGGDRALDPGLVTAVAGWFEQREELYRGAGAVADRPPLPGDASEQDRLLAAFGRDPRWGAA